MKGVLIMSEISTLILNSCQAMFAIDLNGKVIFWNPGSEKLFGFSCAETLGKFLPIINDGSAYEIDNWLEKIKENKQITFKTQKKSKNGEVLDLLISSYPMMQNFKIAGAIAIVQNASVLKNATFIPYNLSPFVRDSKRTFYEIRNEILMSLVKGKMTINQLANDSGINWRTVEKHLTYLIGKKLATEIFSSEYVRVFELTEQGKKCANELKREGLSRYIKTE